MQLAILYDNFHVLEKEMATHSSTLAWRIPGTGEPGGLLSMGLHRVGHDWSNLAAARQLYSGECTSTLFFLEGRRGKQNEMAKPICSFPDRKGKAVNYCPSKTHTHANTHPTITVKILFLAMLCITLPTKVQIVKTMVFSSSHVWM